MGPSERVLRLFTIEVTLDRTLGNWYHFIKPIDRFKNLLTIKCLPNVVSYFIVFIFRRIMEARGMVARKFWETLV
jgi:hypothetical protein